jgi:hypothetical protein
LQLQVVQLRMLRDVGFVGSIAQRIARLHQLQSRCS